MNKSHEALLMFRPLAALLVALAMGPATAHAADVQSQEIVVKGKADKADEKAKNKKARISDTASLLLDQPGVALQTGGGVSNLPVIHGLADDRVLTVVDGMMLISCCPNHMNPALSYIDPSQVGEMKVYAGISPVSLGGDSIGGTIIAESPAPEFAQSGKGEFHGELGSYYRTNGNAKGANLTLGYSTDKLSVTLRSAIAKSDDYTAGGDFKTFAVTGRPGETLPYDVVGSTAYETQNHSLNVAWRNSDNLYEGTVGYQHVPYQLYPNQRMDMLNNQAYRLNLHYMGKKSWGQLEGRLYGERVNHYMDFGKDKQLVYGSSPYVVAIGMPMYTKGSTLGGTLKADVELSKRDILRLGAEAQLYRLDDWWPPSPPDLTGMLFNSTYPFPAFAAGMSPNTFWNINNGKRDRYALFTELESKWSSELMTLLGARVEVVTTDTGEVQGYNNVDSSYNGVSPYYTALYNMYYNGYYLSATNFNALDRKRTDVNLDLTALTRYTPDETHTYEFGFARKTRTPNLYERYSWSRNAMALIMNNFVGDGNGYLGNPDLKPEVAHTVSASASWHNSDKSFEIKASPFYTYVTDYIDAVQWNRTTNTAGVNATGFGILKYMNQTGRLYGFDLSGRLPLGGNGLGEWSSKWLVNYVKGRNLDTGSGLYNVMPLNGKISLEQKTGGLENALELVGVARKSDVSTPRQELSTAGYTLLHWRGSYTYKSVRVDFGVENVFDRLYSLPLGGAYAGQGMTMSLSGIPYGITVPGMGRNAYVGLNCKF